jgi:hypothetical protein
MKREMLQAVAAIKNALLVIEQHAEPPHMKGYRFEKEFVQACRARGLKTRKPSCQGHVDVVVNGKRVQCKHVTQNDVGQVFIQPGQRTWYEQQDFDVLAMKCNESVYIIPMSSLPKTNGHVRIQIKPRAYRRFIDFWQAFDGGDAMPASTTEFLFEDL